MHFALSNAARCFLNECETISIPLSAESKVVVRNVDVEMAADERPTLESGAGNLRHMAVMHHTRPAAPATSSPFHLYSPPRSFKAAKLPPANRQPPPCDSDVLTRRKPHLPVSRTRSFELQLYDTLDLRALAAAINMSGWGMGWFGGAGAAKKKDAPKNAILQLRSTLDMLAKREKHLQNQADDQQGQARKFLAANNQTQAKAALRRKKAFEHNLEQTQAQMMTVEREISSIETANINKETLDAMKNASSAMKQIHNGLTIDKVDATMEDLRDQHAIGEEIADALTQGAVTAGMADEDELQDELDEMMKEELDEKMLKSGSVPVGDRVDMLPTPQQGSKASRVEEDDEDEELKRLQAEMAM
ncbi:hypothetical protein FH972_026081 [Carpinus fangiana]|uniref:Uncharacterized protein n=1 Tax=Carpinus fangiana TaxID=176857 RepID=A0A5N6L2X0_9ROSI|nr:hypothetical protein FH972_026081 [Carpinus fangiana]